MASEKELGTREGTNASLSGDFEGRTYSIEPFPTDDGAGMYRVQRNGGGKYWVQLTPQSCSCPWHDLKVGRIQGDIPDCVHIRAIRSILKGVKDGGKTEGV